MDIHSNELGRIDYGKEKEKELKDIYVGKTIVDVQYDYFAEGFRLMLDNGESIFIDN